MFMQFNSDSLIKKKISPINTKTKTFDFSFMIMIFSFMIKFKRSRKFNQQKKRKKEYHDRKAKHYERGDLP